MQAHKAESSIASLQGGVSKPTSASPASQRTRPLDACVICLEPVSERAVAAPCNHCSFDFLCLASWLQERSTCPLCNTQVSAVEYDWRAPDDFKSLPVPSTAVKQSPHRTARPNNPPLTHRRAVRSSRYSYRPRPPFGETHASATVLAAISRRRHVYRNSLYSLHVGSNRISHWRDFTPQAFSKSSELQSRARKWIRRELQVFDFLGAENNSPFSSSSSSSSHSTAQTPASRGVGNSPINNVEFLLEYIIAILRTIDIKASSGKAQAKLHDFLGPDNANLFFHELGAWLRSPYSALEDWDRHVQYRAKIPDYSARHSSVSGAEEKSCQQGQWRLASLRRQTAAAATFDNDDGNSRAASVHSAAQRYRPD